MLTNDYSLNFFFSPYVQLADPDNACLLLGGAIKEVIDKFIHFQIQKIPHAKRNSFCVLNFAPITKRRLNFKDCFVYSTIIPKKKNLSHTYLRPLPKNRGSILGRYWAGDGRFTTPAYKAIHDTAQRRRN